MLNIYDKITDEYSNEEIANILEQNEEELEKQGVSKEIVSAGADFIRTTDKESLRVILENDIDINSIKEKLDKGYTPNQVMKSMIKETPNDKKIELITKVLLSNQVVKTVITVLVILFIYSIILRWIIYNKAGEHGWAAIIPVYRQIVMYKICDLTPLFMFLWLIPILGWLILIVIAIMKRFYLAKAFGRSTGFGLLILPPIFQSILAFNKNIRYEGIEE